MKLSRASILLFALLLISPAAIAQESNWQNDLKERLSRFGSGNVVVVADAAFPVLSQPGVETIESRADAIDVLRGVLTLLSQSKRLKVNARRDVELRFVPEQDAPGVTQYRSTVGQLLAGFPLDAAPHADNILNLDKTANLYRVLVIKTRLAVPYSALFLQLDTGYWNPEAEKRLRETMGAGK